jgi:membrane protease YdiL (CAAX protease family)
MQGHKVSISKPVTMESHLNPSKGIIIYGHLLSGVLIVLCILGSIYLPALESSVLLPANSLFFISRLLFWMALGIVYWYCQKIEGQNLLLWKNQKQTLLHVCLSILVIFAAVIIGSGIIRVIAHLLNYSANSAIVARLTTYSTPLKLFIIITAAFTEEMLFRGYLMPRLQLLFKNKLWSIIISALLFGLAHFRYATFINIAGPVLIGLIFACYYQKYRNITTLIICHFLIDFISLFFAR